MTLTELRVLLVSTSKHLVWTQRHQGESWSEIAERLEVTEDQARKWFLEWSHRQDMVFEAELPQSPVLLTFGPAGLDIAVPEPVESAAVGRTFSSST